MGRGDRRRGGEYGPVPERRRPRRGDPAALRARVPRRARRLLRSDLRGALPADLDGAGGPLPLRRRAPPRAAGGSHGVYREFIVHGYGTLEETPIAQRALSEDRVVETTDLEHDVPSRYSNLPGITKLTCTPVAAGGRWLGVIFADRDGEPFDLTETERSTMHALGRTAALASHVREVTRQLERSRRLSERIDLAREVHERGTQRLFGISLALGSEVPLAEEDQRRAAAEIEGALADLREALIGSPGGSVLEIQEGSLRAELERLDRQYKDLPLMVEWAEGVDV